MLLKEILNVEFDELLMVEALARKHGILLEVASNILRFNYERAKTDPKPRILLLGRFQHPKTGNKLVAGLNLNYLDKDEIALLQQHIKQIMKPERLYNRYWVGYGLMPKLWLKAYRQYDERYIHSLGAADIKPAHKDYEEPKSPGEPKTPEPQAKEIQKVKEVEAQKAVEPPKEPKPKHGLIRYGKDTLKRLINFVKSKLTRNKKNAQAKQDVKSPDKILSKSKLPEKPKSTEDDEIESLDQIENDHEQNPEKLESMASIDAIVEATVQPKNLTWSSAQNYIHWHSPDKFVEYQPKLRGRILDYAHGTNLVAIYNIIEEELIIDLVDDPTEILAMAEWEWGSTIRMICSSEPIIEYDNTACKQVLDETLQHNEMWSALQEFSDTANQ